MSRFRARRGVTAVVLFTFCACGLQQGGSLDGNGGAGGSGAAGAGGTSVGGGSCFPDSKVCKDPVSGEPICFDADTPETGCKLSGACEPCVTPHATPKCELGACAIDTCEAGYRDCNGNPADGCESNTNADPLNCGDCGTNCVTSGKLCKDGSCQQNTCTPPTLLDCDLNQSNGCEIDGATDAQNCLFCGNVCQLANAINVCVNQACEISGCNADWADCDGEVLNGCETHLTVDPDHCGSCDIECPAENAAPSCENSVCKVVCSAGSANCDANPDCEASTDTVEHCGGCNPCSPANVNNAKCPSGVCGYDTCKSGFGDCDTIKANGCETDVLADNNNCGTCGNVCGAGKTCQNKVCKCTTGFDCGSAGCRTCCEDKHCGGGGQKCCNYQCQQGSC